jgi:hypothetical protein
MLCRNNDSKRFQALRCVWFIEIYDQRDVFESPSESDQGQKDKLVQFSK